MHLVVLKVFVVLASLGIPQMDSYLQFMQKQCCQVFVLKVFSNWATWLRI